MKIEATLECWLAGGGSRVGQVVVREREDGRFSLSHHEDDVRSGLAVSASPEMAREIAKYDDEGRYRPLKSAPNLKHGWRLDLRGVRQLHAALDFLYPAAAGAWLWRREGRLEAVDFRRTANRQTGMYESVKRITNAQADALAGDFCKTEGGCLKTILWKLDEVTPITALPPAKFEAPPEPAFPLLCPEACNLFVAAARNVVRRSRAPL